MKKNYVSWQDDAHFMQLVALLENNEVFVGSSDTVIGLFAMLSQEGFDKLNKIKGRFEKPYLVLLDSIEQIEKFSALKKSSHLASFLDHCWPGPVTVILKARTGLPFFLTGGKETIAIRIPHHQKLRLIIQHVGGLFSTSANKAGEPVPLYFDAIDPDISNQVAAMVTNGEGKSVPSTIIDCSGTRVHVVREGAYPIKKLEHLYGSSFIHEKK